MRAEEVEEEDNFGGSEHDKLMWGLNLKILHDLNNRREQKQWQCNEDTTSNLEWLPLCVCVCECVVCLLAGVQMCDQLEMSVPQQQLHHEQQQQQCVVQCGSGNFKALSTLWLYEAAQHVGAWWGAWHGILHGHVYVCVAYIWAHLSAPEFVSLN